MDYATVPFTELKEAVLNQLKSQKYMDSTLTTYRRTYNRVHVFLNENGTDIYSHEFGKAFIMKSDVCKSTLSAYVCAIRRLDDFVDGNAYRCHHGTLKEDMPEEFADALSGFLNHCENGGNKPATILTKERACISFLNHVKHEGCSNLAEIQPGMVARALLTISNRDLYARLRQFLRYLAAAGIITTDLSGMIPHYKRPITLPTVYTPEEISKIESSIDTSRETGKRDLAIICIASRMGLRAGDIARLKLSEIDFNRGIITIIQEKTGNQLSLQMPSQVHNALLLHLENDKHSLEDGYVFHSMTAPYDRISTSIIRHALNKYFHEGGVNTAGKKHGPHSLRSSLASSMVNDGASYEVVRRILGHTDPDIIKHYAKVDIENLRLCAIDPPAPSGLFLSYLSGKEVMNHV